MTAALLLVLLLPTQGEPAPPTAENPALDSNLSACEQREHALRLQAQNVEARSVQVEAREAAVVKREKSLAAYKAQFTEQVEALFKRVAELERKLNMGEGARMAHEERMAVLTETLTTLSAKKAAPVLASADPNVVGDLLLRLGSTRSAALLALMPPTNAAKFVEQVSRGTTPSPEAKKK